MEWTMEWSLEIRSVRTKKEKKKKKIIIIALANCSHTYHYISEMHSVSEGITENTNGFCFMKRDERSVWKPSALRKWKCDSEFYNIILEC